jgi:cell division protein ZapA
LKKRFEVSILGQEISVTSDSGDEHVANVIRYVSENALNIAILAALNIADEYCRMAGVKENIHSQLESRSEQLIHLINDIR